MRRAAAAVSIAVLAGASAGCGASSNAAPTGHGSSAGPGGVLGIAAEAGVAAGCTNIQTATTYEQAGDDASVRAALRAAITSFRKLPVNPDAATAATAIEGRLGVGDVAGALSIGSTFCRTHGQ